MNNPTGDTVTFGFNIPLSGAYADEGADELRAYELAVEHLNNGGGILETLQPSSLTGQGVLGKKVAYVTGDDQTNPDAARQVSQRMIERDGVIMFTGGSSSATAIANQYLAQEKGVIFMNALTHSNDTTGKDRRRYGFRHFFNAYQSGQALGPILSAEYGDGPQRLPPHGRLHLGPHAVRLDQELDRGSGLVDGQQHHDAARQRPTSPSS